MSEKRELYSKVADDLKRVVEGESDVVARMSSAACLLHSAFEGFLWTGFYRVQGRDLVVGPYQGSLGCLRISFGKGVCGTAAQIAPVTRVDGRIVDGGQPGPITLRLRADYDRAVRGKMPRYSRWVHPVYGCVGAGSSPTR